MGLFKKSKSQKEAKAQKKAQRQANKQAKKDAKIAKKQAKAEKKQAAANLKNAKAEGIKNGTYQPTTAKDVISSVGGAVGNVVGSVFGGGSTTTQVDEYVPENYDEAASFIGENTGTPEWARTTTTTTEKKQSPLLIGGIGLAFMLILLMFVKKR